MTLNTCDGPHYSCEDPIEWLVGGESSRGLSQVRNNKTSFMLGEVEIIVASINRSLAISIADSWALEGAFLMRDSEGDLFDCGELTYDPNGSISETCTYITTVIHFLDTRYNNGVFTETKEVLTFSDTGDMCAFKEAWGIPWYHKFVITNHTVVTTVTHFIVLAGVKTVLKEAVSTTYPNTAENPLILVYPNPPSAAIPWINCEDIDEFGFYDYHEGGPPPGGSQRIAQDGGDDFYWPEWIRAIGQVNAAADVEMKDERYFTFYLNVPNPGTRSISNPGIFTDSTPCASIAVDQGGRVFYSLTLGGQNFNYLEDGNLLELLPYFAADPKFYPVGVI